VPRQKCMGTPTEARVGWGCQQKGTGIPPRRRGQDGGCRQKRMFNQQEARARGAGEKQGVWSVRDRGGGTSSPSPSAPPPRGDIPTVHSMGRSWRRAGYGCPSAPPQIRFPTSSTPDTVSRRLYPGHGCSPDIATHCHRPRGGGGGGAPKARAGWGCPDRSVWVPLQRRGRGGGRRQKRMGILLRRRGRSGGCRQGTCGAYLQGRCRPGGELPEKGSREDARPVSAPARLPAAGAGISPAEEADRANNVRRMSRTCDIISYFHNTWASENHSLHLFRLIGRNVCDREVVRTCN